MAAVMFSNTYYKIEKKKYCNNGKYLHGVMNDVELRYWRAQIS